MPPEQIGQGCHEQYLLIGRATGGKPVQLGGCLARELYRSAHTAVARWLAPRQTIEQGAMLATSDGSTAVRIGKWRPYEMSGGVD
jgi:hypothetical protein